jgi:hypothetical protein
MVVLSQNLIWTTHPTPHRPRKQPVRGAFADSLKQPIVDVVDFSQADEASLHTPATLAAPYRYACIDMPSTNLWLAFCFSVFR